MYIFRLFLFLVVFSTSAFSRVDDHLNIKLGFGRVKIEIVSGELKPKQLQSLQSQLSRIETNLLTDEKLALLVTANEAIDIKIALPPGVLEIDGDRVSISLNTLMAKINAQANKILEPKNKENEEALIVSEGRKRVVMGSHLTVVDGEHLEEVVVIAGSADVKGKVDRLIVVGGDVHLFPTAEIVEDLNVIGGYVKTEPGAKVKGRSTNVGLPMSDQSWDLIYRKLRETPFGQWMTSDLTKFIFNLFKIMALMFFCIAGYYIAPKYQRNVFYFLKAKPVNCLFWGALSMILILPITMMLAISIVGIPLMPLQFSLYFLFFIFGYVQSAHYIAALLNKKFEQIKELNVYLQVFLGLVIFEAMSFIPYVGSTLKWIVIFAGFGAASKIFYQQMLMPHRKRYE